MNGRLYTTHTQTNMSYKPVSDPPVRIKGSLKAVKRRQEIKALILAQLKDCQLNRLDPELIKFIGNKIEALVKSNSGIKKLDMLYDIMQALFPDFSEVDRNLVKGILEFLLSNKDIRKRPIKFFLRSASAAVGAYLCSK